MGKGRKKDGWNGRFFEDFSVGDIYQHPLGRTITEVDNQWFTLLTQNTARLHFDNEYMRTSEYEKPIVNSTFVLALVTGQSVIDLTWNAFANLSWNNVVLPAPVFAGDTIYSRSKVVAKRESRSRESIGIVVVVTEGFNQNGIVVISFERTFMVYRQGHLPVPAITPPDPSSIELLAQESEIRLE